ncbi:MAG: hypothetical protein HKN00_11195 [Flavobacteriaceae bacterium]|nr:hypothetical protein [Bacteroidia bacterium]NNF75743.1 hypothetical protein [Flavobacteriaceae bacterium]
MIKFFRQIRYKLMEAGKTSRYFKYAIGEIILVVVGILIALSINNWNENNKNSKKEIVYLNKLISNLEDDIDLYQLIMANDSTSMNGLRIIQDVISNPSDNNIGKIKLNIQNLMTGNNFIPNRTTFDNLISSGQIEIISNDSIVDQIFLYYRGTEDLEKGIDKAIAEYNRNTFGPFILSFGSFSDTNEDVSKYRNENMMVNSVRFKLNLLGNQLIRYSSQVDNANRLIDHLKKELNID